VKETFSVLIPDGESKFALFATHCLSCYPNIKLHVLSREPFSPIRFSRYQRSFTYKQTNPEDGSLLETVAAIVKKHKIDVLLPTDTEAIAFANANREALSDLLALPPLPDPKSFEIANNKWLLAQFLEEHGFPGQRALLVSADDLFEQNLQTLQFPALLKPITARDGDGIERFEHLSDLRNYFNHHGVKPFAGHFMVQELVPGPVIGLNILSRDGNVLASTIQQGTIPNTKKYAAAGAIKFIKHPDFSTTIQKISSSLLRNGYANLDTICDSQNQLRIIDVNARFWGSLRGSLAAGVNFPYLTCLAALNIPFPAPDYDLIRYFHPQTAMQAKWSRLSGKSLDQDLSFQEMGMRFLLNDPLAEVLRARTQ
jgi:predicted ATP-grasp superfamily ATP-dependent carboligase